MSNQRIVAFYDGRCGLCHKAVAFLLKRDRSGNLYFAPTQSDHYKTFAESKKLALTPRSILVYDETQQRLQKESAAVFYLLGYCGPFWRGVVSICNLLPIAFWDRLYKLIARVRHKFFAEPKSLTPDLPQQYRSRLLG